MEEMDLEKAMDGLRPKPIRPQQVVGVGLLIALGVSLAMLVRMSSSTPVGSGARWPDLPRDLVAFQNHFCAHVRTAAETADCDEMVAAVASLQRGECPRNLLTFIMNPALSANMPKFLELARATIGENCKAALARDLPR